MHASSDAVHVEAENWALDRLGDEDYDPGQPNDYEALYAARSQRIVELEKLRRVEADLRTVQHRREQFERKSREQALASLAHPENIKTVGLLSSSSNASQGPPAGRGRGRALVLPAWMKSTQAAVSRSISVQSQTKEVQTHLALSPASNEHITSLTFTNVLGSQRADVEALCTRCTAFNVHYDGEGLAFVVDFRTHEDAEHARTKVLSIYQDAIIKNSSKS